MNGRWVMVFVVVLALMLGSFAAGVNGADRNPNIVFIFADDMGYGDASCYNPQSKITTPHIDSLASEGMRFTGAYSAAAVCVPSRYSLLTGCYAFRGAPLAWQARPTIREGQMTLASLLQSSGISIRNILASLPASRKCSSNRRPIKSTSVASPGRWLHQVAQRFSPPATAAAG